MKRPPRECVLWALGALSSLTRLTRRRRASPQAREVADEACRGERPRDAQVVLDLPQSPLPRLLLVLECLPHRGEG